MKDNRTECVTVKASL